MRSRSTVSIVGTVLRIVVFGALWLSAVSDAGARQPIAGRTLVFSRTQAKYDLGANYMRRWTDRPLFQDTALRNRVAGQFTTPESWGRILDIGSSYGLDGFAFLPETAGRAQLFALTDRLQPRQFHLLPEFVSAMDPAAKRGVLQAALRCASCIRINGHIPITAYRTDSMPLEKWRELLGAFRGEFGEAFIFLPDIGMPAGQGWEHWLEVYRSQGSLTEADQERIRAYLRDWVTVFDGLYFAGAAAIKTDRRFDQRFYREVLIPAYLSVLAESRFQGKYLGLSAALGHENCTRLGYTLSHHGTKTLRRSFEAAFEARPDLIVLPEWDEQNENTSFRPTVYNSFSTQRILRYYVQRLRGERPTPNPGDDLTAPNLVVSYRKILSLGEVLEVELLNVPDGSTGEPYYVTLALKDLEGRTVASFPEVSFAPPDLADHTLRLPTEELAAYPVLRPSLTVRYRGRQRVFEDGLHHVELRATWNWDYKWVKLPLRDLCIPAVIQFDCDQAATAAMDAGAVKGLSPGFLPLTPNPSPARGEGSVGTPNLFPERGEGSMETPAVVQASAARLRVGGLRVRGRVESDADLAAVEVLDDDDVVYAVDPSGHGLRDRTGEVLLDIELRSFDRVKMHGAITVRNSPCSWPACETNPSRHATCKGNRLSLADNVDWQLRQYFLALPASTAAQAVLDCDFDLLKTTIPVQRVLAGQIYSETHGRGITLTVGLYHRQPDHPLHLNRRRVEFTADVVPDTPASVYHLRAVTTTGRIYCSRPWLPPVADRAATVPLVVWSDSRQTPVTVDVHSSRIPEIEYAFDPSLGTALTTDAGRPFWAHLGGLTDSVTGRGGDGGLDGSPFLRGTTYPKAAKQMAPRWVKEDGADCLAFDGVGNFIAMPQGVLPRRGSFRLVFEIKPAADGPQLLFSHMGNYIGSLTVYLKNGKLGGTFVGERQRKFEFKPTPSVPAGQWSRVEVIYDLASMRFRVNGVASELFPCRGPGLYDTTSVFGGFGDPGPPNRSAGQLGWFRGYLKSFRVIHDSAEPRETSPRQG